MSHLIDFNERINSSNNDLIFLGIVCSKVLIPDSSSKFSLHSSSLKTSSCSDVGSIPTVSINLDVAVAADTKFGLDTPFLKSGVELVRLEKSCPMLTPMEVRLTAE